MKLPKSLEKTLQDYSVGNIIFTTVADVHEDYVFANTYIVIAEDRLVIAAYPQNKVEYRLGGYDSEWQDEKAAHQDAAVRMYELAHVERLKVEREIGGGILFAEIDGKEILLCRFTNTRMDAFMRCTNIFDKIKKGEEITEDDLKGRKRECCPKCGSLYPDPERKVCPRCMDKRSIFIRLAGYLKSYKAALVGMFACYIATAMLNIAWPYLSGTVLYDKVLAKDAAFMELFHFPAGNYVLLLGMVVLTMIVTKIIIQVVGIIQGVFTARIAPDIMARMKNQVFDSMGRLSISFYNRRQTGGLMTRVADDAEEVTGFFIDGLPYFFINIGTIIATVVIMFSMNPLLAVISICLLPLLFIISFYMMPRLWHTYGKRHRANRSLNGQMNENFTGARVVKAFGQEKQELKRFAMRNNRVKDAELLVAKYDNRFYALFTGVENVADFLVWGTGAALILNSTGLELGILITFTGYVAQLKGPLDFMSRFIRWYTNAMNSAQRMFEIIDAQPEVKEKENPVILPEMKGEIELKNVTFGYEPHKPVLKNINFHIGAGEMLGIVGRSGAGKTTLVNLISRLYDAEEGEVLVDGVNVKELSFAQLRKSIAMVSQETYIFMGTVAENIAYARPDATRKEIIEAAVKASAHDFICKMPEGYDTVLGASGRSLSGGERQRISIARAILANPRILILDEATSAVDTETELAIQESLERLVKDRTTISIAHRLSTLRNADKLIVIDRGEVTESGTHRELIELKGTFHKLMELQTKALALKGIE
ncbi:MAG: ABC transporter ATP-binding protein [Lachnospiraceae bacterium]|nr:ABC transporter ATP-binding protein [Lachnospiraceae bacterium]